MSQLSELDVKREIKQESQSKLSPLTIKQIQSGNILKDHSDSYGLFVDNQQVINITLYACAVNVCHTQFGTEVTFNDCTGSIMCSCWTQGLISKELKDKVLSLKYFMCFHIPQIQIIPSY